MGVSQHSRLRGVNEPIWPGRVCAEGRRPDTRVFAGRGVEVPDDGRWRPSVCGVGRGAAPLACQRASMAEGSRINPVRRAMTWRYDAAVPELSAGLPGIPDLPWELLSHRQALAALATDGWVPCGVGDWAVALRSPEGSLVARVCPFDPAYWAFVDLCRECAGNRWLPRVELAADLEGGGSVVFLEFVAPVGHPVVKQFAEQWQARAGDPEFQEVSRAAQSIDAEYRKSTPWWGRCGRSVGSLGPGLTSESADAARAVLRSTCRPGPAPGTHRRCRSDLPGLDQRPGFTGPGGQRVRAIP